MAFSADLAFSLTALETKWLLMAVAESRSLLQSLRRGRVPLETPFMHSLAIFQLAACRSNT